MTSSLERKIAMVEIKKKKNATDGNTCNNADEEPNQKIKNPLQASWLVVV
jgi:hypothetical protein